MKSNVIYYVTYILPGSEYNYGFYCKKVVYDNKTGTTKLCDLIKKEEYEGVEVECDNRIFEMKAVTIPTKSLISIVEFDYLKDKTSLQVVK